MKIGIITYHRANNVGAVLQNFALQHILKDKYDVETIDYRCSFIENNNRFFAKRGIKDWIKILLQFKSYIVREKAFNTFRDSYLILSRQIFNRSNISKAGYGYDVLITGSDQVWNLNLNGNDLSYFLDFACPSNRKISYAASMGYNQFRDGIEMKCIELLNNFDCITVREEALNQYFKSKGITSSTVVDPTLLLTGNQWLDSIKIKRLSQDRYVFIYMVAYTPELISEAKKYAKERNLKVIIMHYSYKILPGMTNIRDAGPVEFLSYLFYSDKVYCSSFHALCFSILFHKEVVCGLDKNKINNNSRLLSLCDALNIRCCILGDEAKNSIDYEKVDQRLEQLRSYSISELIRGIGESR